MEENAPGSDTAGATFDPLAADPSVGAWTYAPLTEATLPLQAMSNVPLVVAPVPEHPSAHPRPEGRRQNVALTRTPYAKALSVEIAPSPGRIHWRSGVMFSQGVAWML